MSELSRRDACQFCCSQQAHAAAHRPARRDDARCPCDLLSDRDVLIDADARQGKRFCCRSRGVELDADANAAINIRALGMKSARRREGISSLRGRQAHTQTGNGAIREPSVLAPETLPEGTFSTAEREQENHKGPPEHNRPSQDDTRR